MGNVSEWLDMKPLPTELITAGDMYYLAKQLEKHVQCRIALLSFSKWMLDVTWRYITLHQKTTFHRQLGKLCVHYYPSHEGITHHTSQGRNTLSHFTKLTKLIITNRYLLNSLKDWKQYAELSTVLDADVTFATIRHSSVIIQQQKNCQRQQKQVLLSDFLATK